MREIPVIDMRDPVGRERCDFRVHDAIDHIVRKRLGIGRDEFGNRTTTPRSTSGICLRRSEDAYERAIQHLWDEAVKMERAWVTASERGTEPFGGSCRERPGYVIIDNYGASLHCFECETRVNYFRH